MEISTGDFENDRKVDKVRKHKVCVRDKHTNIILISPKMWKPNDYNNFLPAYSSTFVCILGGYKVAYRFVFRNSFLQLAAYKWIVTKSSIKYSSWIVSSVSFLFVVLHV